VAIVGLLVFGSPVLAAAPALAAGLAGVGTGSAVIAEDANQGELGPLSAFERVKVVGQVATTVLANLPTQAEAGAVMGSSFVEVAGYYVSQKVGSAGALAGLRSRVVGEYVGRSGDGFLGVTIAEFASPAAAAKAMKAEAREIGVKLEPRGKELGGPPPWGGAQTWAGTNAEGDAGMAVALAGSALMRMTLAPAKGPWSPSQWERAWGEAHALQERLVTPGAELSPPAYLLGLVPAASPPGLIPIAAGTRSRDGWLSSGKPSSSLYQSMRPVNLTLQYAIARAAPQLLLQVVVAPTSNPALAQEYVSTLRANPDSVGEYPIDGLPPGAVTISFQGESGIDALQTQFVGENALVDVTCSGVTRAPSIQPALDACVKATQELGRVFGR